MHTLAILLDVEISAAFLEAGKNIVIAKSFGPRAPLIAWVVLPPSLVVSLSWTDEFGIFAAPVPARAGLPVVVENALYPARDRTTYRYRNGGFEALPPSGDRLPEWHYGVVNKSPEATAFGLLQRVSTDGIEAALPMNIAVLAPDVPADLIPEDDVVVWWDMTTVASAVIAAVPPCALVIPWRRTAFATLFIRRNADAFVWIGE